MKCPSCGIENLEDSRFCRKCATALPGGEASFTRTLAQGPAELASGTVIAGHYKINRILGRGGMGVVYLADDTRLKRPVALKFLPPGLALDEDIRKRFMIEAQAAAALSHPNICTIYEVDDQAEKAFISMEYVEGESLREKIAKGPLPFDDVLDIALQVCAGLDEAHKKGIVHRDIKSANIMLTAKGQAKIMDFGLAKVAGTAMVTKEGSTMGTVAYMSPEQARGEAVDARTDIWSLGVVLYELASGKLPFRGDLESAIIHNIIHEEPKPLKAIVPKVPGRIREDRQTGAEEEGGRPLRLGGRDAGRPQEAPCGSRKGEGRRIQPPFLPPHHPQASCRRSLCPCPHRPRFRDLFHPQSPSENPLGGTSRHPRNRTPPRSIG